MAYCLCGMGNGNATGDGEQRPAVPPVVRAGCLALAALGAFSMILGGPAIMNPGGIRCSLARTLIDDANHDSKKFNDVDMGGRQVDDLNCEEAQTLAETSRRNENSDDTISLPSKGLIRNRGLMSAVVAIGQGVSGFLTLTTLRRRNRTAALVFTALGVVVPLLGLVSVLVLGFVIYALVFSAPSRALWPSRSRPSRES